MKSYSDSQFVGLLERIVEHATRFSLSGRPFDVESAEIPFRFAINRLLESFPRLRDRYYTAPTELDGLGMHGDIYANLLLRFGAALNAAGRRHDAEIIWTFNRILHGLDFFAYGEIPDVLQLSHPVGTVVGRARLGTALMLYQGVTVGASERADLNSYPVFEGRTILYANSSVLGRCTVGDGVVFAANALIVNCDVPSNSLVVGQYPNHRFVAGVEEHLDYCFR